jgi:hypothetical protein
MKILLINIDSKIPNFALHKVGLYHKTQGHKVVWDYPLMASKADKIYVSCVFKKNRAEAAEYENFPNAFIGGSGYSLETVLPEKIEEIKPHINLGFTTRGCNRRCGFCVVPEKEGGVKVVGDLYDLWDTKSKSVIILDNNILQAPNNHFEWICHQAKVARIKIDFNQGLDWRLLTPDVATTLKRTPHLGEWRFAYDHPLMREGVERAVELLKSHGINRCTWYVLVGYNTTFEEDLTRLNHLRDMGQTAFVQRYKMTPELIPLARWANQRHMFRKMTFEQFIKHPAKASYYKRLKAER